MKAVILGSGSKGNATLLIDNEHKILIDVGFSYPKIKLLLESFNYDPLDIDGIIITHSHKDHIGGLASFVKKNKTKVFVNEELSLDIRKLIPEENIVLVDDNFAISDFQINSFKTSHDSRGSVGFIIENHKKTLVYVTDTGYLNKNILDKMINKDAYIFESNHDVEMLMEGPYPYILKQRILSDKGHLSNELAGTYLRDIIGINTKKIALAHLSETNNRKEIALETTKDIIGDKVQNVEIVVALQDEVVDLGEI